MLLTSMTSHSHTHKPHFAWLCMHQTMHVQGMAACLELLQLQLYLARYRVKHTPSSNTCKQAYSMLSMIQAPCCYFLEARHVRLLGHAVRQRGIGWWLKQPNGGAPLRSGSVPSLRYGHSDLTSLRRCCLLWGWARYTSTTHPIHETMICSSSVQWDSGQART